MKITKEKRVEFQKELKLRLGSLRTKIKNEVLYATEQGDFYRENFPFQAAIEKQEQNEKRIAELEEILKLATDVDVQTHDKVQMGSKVEFCKNGVKRQILLVSSFEANPSENKISVESPLGKSLLGKAKGDSFVFKLDSSTVEVLNIS